MFDSRWWLFVLRWLEYNPGMVHTKMPDQYYRDWYAANREKRREQIDAASIRNRKRNRDYIAGVLQGKSCVDCGELDPIVLEFDHVTGEKIKAVSQMVSAVWSIARIEEEIAKCVIRCANCHRRKTARESSSWWKLTHPDLMRL